MRPAQFQLPWCSPCAADAPLLEADQLHIRIKVSSFCKLKVTVRFADQCARQLVFRLMSHRCDAIAQTPWTVDVAAGNFEHLSSLLRGCPLHLKQRLPAWATLVQLPLAAAGAVAAAVALEQPLVRAPWLPMCSRPVLAILGHSAGPAHKHQGTSITQT